MGVKTKTVVATITVGLDVGYGVTKLTDGVTEIKFPSVWGKSREVKFRADELAAKYPGDQISDDSGDWFVGELALSQLHHGELLRLRGRGANELHNAHVHRVRMMCVALGKLLPNATDVVHMRVATGLPVDHMRGAATLKQALIGQHVIRTDHANFIANVVDVIVMPQPYGTIYGQMLTPDGYQNPGYISNRTGVVDVGTYTIDLTLDADGEYIDAESGSVEGGLFLTQQRLAEAIESEFHQTPHYRSIEQVLRTGILNARGNNYDFRSILEEALEPVRNATLVRMQELWQAGLNVDAVYLAGGGAELVKRAVLDAGWDQAAVVDNPQMANATGYLHYARWTERETAR